MDILPATDTFGLMQRYKILNLRFHIYLHPHLLLHLKQSISLPRIKCSIFISNTMTLGKLVIKCPRKPREDLWKSRGR